MKFFFIFLSTTDNGYIIGHLHFFFVNELFSTLFHFYIRFLVTDYECSLLELLVIKLLSAKCAVILSHHLLTYSDIYFFFFIELKILIVKPVHLYSFLAIASCLNFAPKSIKIFVYIISKYSHIFYD